MYKRILDLSPSSSQSVFLWGARQTGKSTLLRTLFPRARIYDLLQSDVFRRLLNNPETIRQECLAAGLTGESQTDPVIIDEVQKLPDLIDEVHWMIENRGLRFILCGSSARKLKRHHGSLLGGRAVRRLLRPLVYPEIPDFSLERALSAGLLPPHYLSTSHRELLRSYVGDYLKEEIAAEALTRNIPAFSRFLEIAALSNGQTVNYVNIARECGVSSPTVKAYFQILVDTLLATELPAYAKRRKRRLISGPKYVFCDVGVVGELTRRGDVVQGSEVFGRAFEHFIHGELASYSEYTGIHYPIAYWRTTSQFEVDYVLGDLEIAVEVKATSAAQEHHLRCLRALKEESPSTRCILVSQDAQPRLTADGIEIAPWQRFLDQLWSGKVVSR